MQRREPRKRKIARISGFPETLPDEMLVFSQWQKKITETFEEFGFSPLITRSVEEIDTIARKGADVDKEIYALVRLEDVLDGVPNPESRLALHFDLTVPFARYVAEHAGRLVFPFKRYQIQPVWRGERAQEGRYREFYQCDVDVVDTPTVSDFYDRHMPEVMLEALSRLDIPGLVFSINDRRVLEAFYEKLEIEDPLGVIRVMDKLDKVGVQETRATLMEALKLGEHQADHCLRLAEIRSRDSSFIDAVKELGAMSERLNAALQDLDRVREHLLVRDYADIRVEVNLSIARGLDYYTGVVFEGHLEDYAGFPAICSGGRYENLVQSLSGRSIGGIGGSIGLTRLLLKMLKEGLVKANASSPTELALFYLADSDDAKLRSVAGTLRARGIRVEECGGPERYDKLVRYCTRKSIRYCAYRDADARLKLRDLSAGEEREFDVETWRP